MALDGRWEKCCDRESEIGITTYNGIKNDRMLTVKINIIQSQVFDHIIQLTADVQTA